MNTPYKNCYRVFCVAWFTWCVIRRVADNFLLMSLHCSLDSTCGIFVVLCYGKITVVHMVIFLYELILFWWFCYCVIWSGYVAIWIEAVVCRTVCVMIGERYLRSCVPSFYQRQILLRSDLDTVWSEWGTLWSESRRSDLNRGFRGHRYLIVCFLLKSFTVHFHRLVGN